MIKIKVLAVGKIKEKYFCDAIDEYLKRLKKYCQIEIVEVKDEKDYDDLEITKQIEGKRIIEKLDKTYYNVFLDDRAGLGETAEILFELIEEIEKGELKFEDYSYFGNLSQYEKMMVDTLRKEGMSDKDILESLKVM